jgi:glycosyltransferase involved in cell wall biosynthesis
MIIAVNTRFLLGNDLEGVGYFTKEVLSLLTTQCPQHQFHFIFDRAYDHKFIFSQNVQPHIISPQARHPILWKYWFDIKVPLLLKRIKADVFLSTDGQCSLTTKVPQCLILHDLAFLHYPETYQKSHFIYYKRNTPKFVRKAKVVATVSQFSKEDIIKQYKTAGKKITVVYNGVKDIFTPTSFEAQIIIKEKYTAGAEFFLYAGAIHPRKNLINLLKAFSIFKRRLQSSMKLVLAGRLAWKNDEFLTLLNTYKYKGDVVLTGYLEESKLAGLMAAAYAFVYPSFFEGFGVPVIEAMKCAVPVLTSKDSAMQEISKGTALYFDPANVNDIAEKLMLIYKDEKGRQELIEKGNVVAQKYTWQKTANTVLDAIMAIVNQQS